MWSERLRWWLYGRRVALARQLEQDLEAQDRERALLDERGMMALRRMARVGRDMGDCYVMRSVAELMGE